MLAETPQIKLRSKRLADAALDYQWQTDPEFARLHAKPALSMTFAEFMAEYLFVLKNQWPGRLHFAIETEDGTCIGDCACHNINRNTKEAEIGINIARREFWDKGYGAAALGQFIEYIFSCTDLQKLKLRTLPDNLRAQKCFLKAGFRQVGFIEEDGCHFLRMELAREDWLKSTGKHPEPPAIED